MRSLVLVAMILLSALPVCAEVEGVRVFVQVAADTPTEDLVALEGTAADGVVLPAEALRAEDARARVAALKGAGLECWGALDLRDDFGAEDLPTAGVVAASGADALLLISLPPIPEGTWPARQVTDDALVAAYVGRFGADPRAAPEDSFERLLYVKLTGDRTTALLAELAAAVDLPIVLALRPGDERPETARGRYLDVEALVARGIIDGVLFAAEAPVELRRPRLATDRAIIAGLLAPGSPEAATLAALRSPTADTLVVAAGGEPPTDTAARVARAAEGYRTQEAGRNAIAEALAAGTMVVAVGAEPEGELDLATIHGVGQSFVLDAPAQVAAVGLFGSLRGAGALGLADQVVQLCADADGAPDTAQVLAEGRIPASAFADAGWAWGYARFDPPVTLEAGRTWWLHCPNSQAAGGSYLWRVSKDPELCPSGRAWSRTYDYAGYDWVFRIVTPAMTAEGAAP